MQHRTGRIESESAGQYGSGPVMPGPVGPARALPATGGTDVRRRSPTADVVHTLLGDGLPVAFTFHDGGRLGPADASATVHVRSTDALRRLVTAPGELGFARAYVAGDIELDGDIYDVLELRHRMPRPRLSPSVWAAAVRTLGSSALRPLPPPPEEFRGHGRLHSLRRDAVSISHHYDVSNDFYQRVLGPSMTYSCAVFGDSDISLEAAQWSKLELVCSKLALSPGMRMLDVGCGWGSLARHAARMHGVRVLGVTLSVEQAEWARERIAREGLSEAVEIRVQDYREVADGPFDAISSIGMSEHVGGSELNAYFRCLAHLLAPGGRLLNHAISRPPGERSAIARGTFMSRYVFPDAALVEVGEVITAMQSAGLEARHMESLREHYVRTLRSWVANLEHNWEPCVKDAGLPRARIWRLYMAGSALGFEDARLGIAQVLGTHAGSPGFPTRPDWTIAPVAPPDPFAIPGRRRSDVTGR